MTDKGVFKTPIVTIYEKMITLWKIQSQTVLRSYLSKNRSKKDRHMLGGVRRKGTCAASGNGNFATTMEISMETPQKTRATVSLRYLFLGICLVLARWLSR